MSKNNTLRWGILGAARINQQLMPAIVAAKNSELVAIASNREGAAAELLAQYAPEQQDNVRIYQQRDELLKDERIQAVYIPLTNKDHAQWALKAIEHGKHVLCEKPMALTVDNIKAIEAAAQKHNVVVMEGFMYGFHPQHARVKAIIESGVIGEVRSVRSCFSFMMQPARLYRLADTIENGGGAMWDIGCYAIHTARQPFKGEVPIAVTAMANQIDNGADVSCSGIIDFAEGKFAQFDFSFERARRAEYEVVGTKGGLKCHNVWAKPNETPVISWWAESGEGDTEKLPLANHFLLEVEHFVDCVLQGKAPALSFEDAKSNCQIINAALQSVASGQKISLSS